MFVFYKILFCIHCWPVACWSASWIPLNYCSFYFWSGLIRGAITIPNIEGAQKFLGPRGVSESAPFMNILGFLPPTFRGLGDPCMAWRPWEWWYFWDIYLMKSYSSKWEFLTKLLLYGLKFWIPPCKVDENIVKVITIKWVLSSM